MRPEGTQRTGPKPLPGTARAQRWRAVAFTRGCRTNPLLFGPLPPRKWVMPQNFLSCDRDQPMLLPPDLREWLDDDHLAWFVIEAIEELDLEPFYASYRADGHGRAAHDPKTVSYTHLTLPTILRV